MTAIVQRRGRQKNITQEFWSGSFDLLDHDFDDGTDDAIALIRHEIEMHGVAPLHPDDNRITTYDPVPLVGDNGRDRNGPSHAEKVADARAKWRLPPPKLEPPQPADQVIAWLQHGSTEEEQRATARHVTKQPKPKPIVEWLPGNFKWLLDDDKRISQAEIERFWIEHRLRNFAFQTIRVQKEAP